VEDITGKQTIYNPCGLKVVSSIVVDLIHLSCELHVCAVGTFVLLVLKSIPRLGKIRKQSSFVHLYPMRQDKLGNALFISK